MFLRRRKTKKLLDKFCSENKSLKLHIGCGRNYKQGWINIDRHSRVRTDLQLDLRKSTPLYDDSIDFIFNEHFIEHLSYEDGLRFFKEAYRILKPKGVIRTSCPDLDALIDSYLKDYWRQMEWVKLINAQWYPSGCFMLNQCIREKGAHLYMYNANELKRRLKEAGFKEENIYECKIKESKFPELRDVEKRADSCVVEAIK